MSNNKTIEATNRRFRKDFKDVVADPESYSAARTLAHVKWSKRPADRPWEIANEVGNEIRELKRRNWRRNTLAEMREERVGGSRSVISRLQG